MQIKRVYINALKYAGHQAISFYALPLMMVIVILGTVSQKWLGLHGALDTYFYAPVFWVGPLPVPGGILVMGAIFINLLARFIGYSVWTWPKIGIHLSHLGFLLLLVGGIVSAFSRTDTVIPIVENTSTSTSQSYDQSRLVVYKNNAEIFSKNFEDISNGTLSAPALPFEIKILNTCLNCKIELRDKDSAEGWIGASAKMKLVPAKPDINPEANLTGLGFEVSGKGVSGKYQTFLFFPKPPVIQVENDEYRFEIKRIEYPLPFMVTLKDFRKTLYPGTDRPLSYESDIIITDSDTEFPATISMNKPLTYKGYTLYQSSYQIRPDGTEVSVLATVYNTGRYFPYIACLLLSIGLLTHLYLRSFTSGARRFKKSTVAALIIFASILPVKNSYAFETGENFKTLPIVHEGRIKPIDSFAKSVLGGLSADELAMIIFDPAYAIHQPIFKIENTKTLIHLGVGSDPSQKFSFSTLSPALDNTKDEFFKLLEAQEQGRTLSDQDKGLLKIHSEALLYLQLLRSFSFAMPLGEINGKPITYIDLQKDSAYLREDLNTTIKNKGTEFDKLSKAEQENLFMNYQMDILEKSGQTNATFRVIPKGDIMVAPWQVISSGQGTPETSEIMTIWTKMMTAYQNNDSDAFDKHTKNLMEKYAAHASTRNLKIEVVYNFISPVLSGCILIFLSCFLLLMHTLHNRTSILKSSKIAAFSASIFIGADIVMRIILLGRPPVGTLYESMIFVAFVLSTAALWLLHKYKREDIGIFTFALTGIILLSSQFLPKGQSGLSVLDAVLNTNFWLATHVLIITVGYAWCLLVSGLAHISLYKNENVSKTLQIHALIALLLVSVGTILGGIWADMSWGRFWGWDPKENGALLICIWLVWVIHGHISKHINDHWYLLLMAGVSIPVALAWFGVNLLNVGLHSYGFVSGIAAGLLSFLVLQTGILCALYMRKKNTNTKV